MPDHLQPAEAVCVERDAVPNPWHVTDVTVLGGDGLTVAEVRARVADRLTTVPRWRQRPVATAVGQVWADDPEFDVAAHVRELPLPEHATIAQLQARVGELQHEPLSRRGPRWEIGVVPSLRGRRSALITRVNPAWVDGVDGVHLLSELVDGSPDATIPAAPEWAPGPQPSNDDLLANLTDVARDPIPALTGVAQLTGRAARWGLQQLGAVPVERRSRHVAGTGAPLEQLREVARRCDVRVHDVLLGMVAGGLRRVGERVDPTAAVAHATRPGATVPAIGVGVRVDAFRLPVLVPSSHGRLEQLATLTQARVDSGDLVGARQLTRLPGFLAPSLHTVAARAAAVAPAHGVLIVDVPGPQRPRYVGERPIKASYPVLSLTGNQKLTVGATCYDGQVLVGLCGVGPVAELADAMLDELHDLAQR